MSIPGAASPLFLATAGEAAAFEIPRSLRFNSADSAFLNRTPSSAGNRKTWTWSGWVKRSQLGVTQGRLFGGGTSDYFDLYFPSGDELRVIWTGNSFTTTTAVFRDPSAWYHIVLAVDTTQSTANDRIKLYVNGVLQDRASTNPSQDYDTAVNNTVEHHIGRYAGSNSLSYFNGCLAEINFIDGQALDPTSFGAFDDNGVWQAKNTSGLTFGTNGFRLKFADNSTNALLGTDSSGNSNTWTVNNLSVGTAVNPTAQQNFNAVTYSGNGGTQSIASLAFQPDFVWLKARNSSSYSHNLFDSVRGATKILYSDSTSAENTDANSLTSFNANGFALGSTAATNNNGTNYIAWCWKAGGAASSNTDGTVTSSVSANASYGFSICTYTGTGANATVGHGLNTAPSMYIIKNRTNSYEWGVYHISIGTGAAQNLNYANNNSVSNTWWNNTAPTSSVFSIGTYAAVNQNNSNFVAYVWSEVAGFSKFGSYTGSGSSGKTVTTGFKPRFVLVKRTTNISGSHMGWSIVDSERGSTQKLQAQSSAQENDGPINAASPNDDVTFNNNGFTLASGGAASNASGETYIYAAFAETVLNQFGIDSLVDTPTNAAEPSDTGVGNEVTGNYATLNPLQNATGETFSDGNLKVVTNLSNYGTHTSTMATPLTGKWYAEVTVGSSTTYSAIGLAAIDSTFTSTSWLGSLNGVAYYSQLQKVYLDSVASSYGTAYGNDDVIGIAYDADNGTATFYKNGTSQGTINSVPVRNYYFAGCNFDASSSATYYWNFGQREFSYAAPSGYKTLNTANLPTPTIADPSQYFDAKLYTGNASSNTISGLNFAPDFLWLKSRGSAQSHALFDLVRGSGQRLQSNATSAEDAYSSFFTGFTSDGFTLNQNSGINQNNDPLIAWAWDGGTSTVTNNDGSVASQVRAQPSAGFSIVTWTHGTAPYTVGHGLNAEPYLIITKSRTGSSTNWSTYHKSTGNQSRTYLNLNLAASSGESVWNNTTPTSSVFSLGSSGEFSGNMVAYCFAPVANYSQMGIYQGNGNATGPFVFTGFRPAFVLWKRTDALDNWSIIDSSRSPYNVADDWLGPNFSSSESSNNPAYAIDLCSNGFKIRATHSATNASGGSYIYAAFAENPFQANGGLAR